MNCKIAEDRLRGVKAIAEEMGETEKRAACGALRASYCANSIGPEYAASRSSGGETARFRGEGRPAPARHDLAHA
jgi:hypothetical protein